MGKMVDEKQIELLKSLANSKKDEPLQCKKINCGECILGVTNGYCLGCLVKREEGIKFAKEYLEKYIKGDNMEKNFREVIRDIKDGEVWESENNSCDVRVIKDMTGIQIRDFKDNALVFFSDSWKFKLQRKQYTFTEAFKAYEEGKEIESCVDKKYKHELRNEVPYYKNNNIEWTKYNSSGELFSINEIRGLWYINDNESYLSDNFDELDYSN